MSPIIEKLIAKYEERQALVSADIEEREEMMGEDFNPQDWSGGNFDDAYEMGVNDGERYGESQTLRDIIADLEKLLEGEA